MKLDSEVDKSGKYDESDYYWSMVCLGFFSVGFIVTLVCTLNLLRVRLLEMFGL
jgi:hypothetical protein